MAHGVLEAVGTHEGGDVVLTSKLFEIGQPGGVQPQTGTAVFVSPIAGIVKKVFVVSEADAVQKSFYVDRTLLGVESDDFVTDGAMEQGISQAFVPSWGGDDTQASLKVGEAFAVRSNGEGSETTNAYVTVVIGRTGLNNMGAESTYVSGSFLGTAALTANFPISYDSRMTGIFYGTETLMTANLTVNIRKNQTQNQGQVSVGNGTQLGVTDGLAGVSNWLTNMASATNPDPFHLLNPGDFLELSTSGNVGSTSQIAYTYVFRPSF